MKTELTSLEISYILKELSILIGGKVNKIYGDEDITIQFYVKNYGKKLLRILNGKALFLTDYKIDSKTGNFCMFLRKHLHNTYLKAIKQLYPERILLLGFEHHKNLIVELFKPGNIILCEKDKILLPLHIRRFRDREIKPKVIYKYPQKKLNFFELEFSIFKSSLNESNKPLVIFLATDLGLGGVYAEELCLISKIDKNIKASELKDGDIKKLLTNIKKFLNQEIKASIVYKNNEIVNVIPFDLKLYRDYRKKYFDTYSKALDENFLLQREPTEKDKQIKKLNVIIKKQHEKIRELEKLEVGLRNKAQYIYENYQLLNTILEEVKKAIKRYGWNIPKELLDKLNIKDINYKERKFIVEL